MTLKQSWARLSVCVIFTLILWFTPNPEGLTIQAWHFLGLFLTVILSFIVSPFPMGPMVLLGLVALSMTHTMTLKGALAGYGNSTVWLVVAAFLIAGAVRRTGLGRRIALLLVKALGKSTLGLGYALCGTELLLGPVVPSNTARGGGIIAPVMNSLSEALESYPDKEPRKAGDYLALVGAHANLITAAMFLTGMAANPLVAKAAKDVLNIEFSWGTWALGAIVPGLIGLVLLPILFYFIAKPTLTDARAAQNKAQSDLEEMGPWTLSEKIMAATFILLILLWATASLHHMKSTLVAWIGVCVLILTGTQNWKEMVNDSAAWDTLVWLGGLLAMANGLKTVGVVDWFATSVQSSVASTGFSPLVMIIVLGVIYFYSMYGFSMLTAHISALVAVFFAVCLSVNAPPYLTAAILAYFSCLCACLTNYSTGPIIIYFGFGYVSPKRWFIMGAIVSVFHLIIWLGVGLLWWKFLGWW